MKLTIERPKYKDTIVLEHKSDDLTVEQVIEALVRPALLGLGFHADSIVEVIGEVNDDCMAEWRQDEV